ncbi:glycosyltransferase family 2 protein [Parapedobacter sp. ISTM3]|uniref:Glycosyltransferase involved in cell wall bisynthesis n=1 Tax=Parapedobacter luteus TaxID=623280 RepID=A0A1T5BN55_9SPHI|nr:MULTISPECIES: glycosyltransferase family 2 protein [Parapedobacter]MBK1439385.1 glycosyltransferase family 2 protein [Parapedobacter sp. ISTM3]SKB48706.1 Glycosyltransferase involved in cell wall bisynthesis [Parapedobacter luteus]
MSEPLITIGIPFYNNEHTIVDTVKSVFAQTYQHWELILINDGSSDRSVEVLGDIDDPRVQIIDDRTHRGLVYRLNQITALAKGEFIARMDGDDMMMPKRLEKQLALILSDSQIDVVDTAAYTMDEHCQPVGKRGAQPIRRGAQNVVTSMMLLHGSILGRKKWFAQHPYDPVYVRAEDYELFCRTHAVSDFQRVPEYLYIIREGNVNIANYLKSKKTLRKILRVYGKGILPPAVYWKQVADTYLKSFLYLAAGIAKLQRHLSARRNEQLDSDERRQLSDVITAIKCVQLPRRIGMKS